MARAPPVAAAAAVASLQTSSWHCTAYSLLPTADRGLLHTLLLLLLLLLLLCSHCCHANLTSCAALAESPAAELSAWTHHSQTQPYRTTRNNSNITCNCNGSKSVAACPGTAMPGICNCSRIQLRCVVVVLKTAGRCCPQADAMLTTYL
jgi:hypothetical protein